MTPGRKMMFIQKLLIMGMNTTQIPNAGVSRKTQLFFGAVINADIRQDQFTKVTFWSTPDGWMNYMHEERMNYF